MTMSCVRRRSRALPRLGAIALACVFAGAAQAVSFGEVFEAALSHDPQLQGARFERESTQQGVPIARSGLLPSVTLNMSQARVEGVREFPNALDQSVRQDLSYKSPQRSLSMRVPLFNYEAISRYRQSLAQYDYADALFKVRSNDLLDRLGTAYLQRLLAEEGIRLSQAQVNAIEAQRERARRMMQSGEATRIEVAETEAALDVARVQLIEAQDQLTLARRLLLRITGVDAAVLNDLPLDFRPEPLEPQDLASWQERAVRSNPNILSRQLAVESARLNIHRNQAGHLPRLDLVASATMNRNESLSTLSQESRLRTLALQLNVPLYSGGGVSASVRQAAADMARAELDA
jgi:protease secretion system outer membrane protein